MKIVSISRRLMTSLAGVILTVFTLIGFTAYTAVYVIQIRGLEKSANAALITFSNSLIDPVLNLKEDEVRRLSVICLQTEIITGVEVAFGDKKINLKKGDSPETGKTIKKDLVYKDEIIGTASINFTDNFIILSLNTAALLSIAVLLFLLSAVVLSIKIIIRRTLERHVEKLSDNIEIIASGGYNHILEVVPQSELNIIVAAINRMSQQIFLRDNEIREGRQLLQDLIESISSMIAAADLNGIVTHCNRAFSGFAMLPAEKIIGSGLFSAAPGLAKFEPAAAEVRAKGSIKHFQRETFDDIDEKYFRVAVYPLISNGIIGFIILIDDITELTIKEEQLRQAQKMETMGALAGGLAHDFNNALGGITGVVSLLKHQIAGRNDIPADDLLELLDIIDNSGNRAAEMVQQLLDLSRLEKLKPGRADLREAILRVIKLCAKTFDKSITIEYDIMEDPAYANIDLTGIEQVLFNLAINASHSMTVMRKPGDCQGGILSFTLCDIKADRHFILAHPEAKEILYRVAIVRDTGVGISNKILPKIFEPFFTTKEKGSGTGLGLSMVYNIVKLHEGFVDVYSEVGLGSVFNVYIPALLSEEAAVLPGAPPIPRGSGLILIADDDPVMRLISESILRESGYDVAAAANGRAALDIYSGRHSEIKLVLMDLVMPVMNGLDAFLAMKKAYPGIKVVMMSGFRQDPRIDRALEYGAVGFIQKPFTFETLAAAVDKAVRGDE